ncbi:MAG: iron-sulfur cluster assembly accessory protein [Rhodospirillales bacterium]|nr:MAG: iron-sulfur cluster assembly accessory protein [Rhodospirillales bacterium]
MVALTDAATTVIKRLVAGSKEGVDGLRIMVEHGGCSGLQYMLGLESRADPGDEVYEFDGVRVYVDAHSLPIVHGMQVDFVETLEQSGFVFDNPNVGDVCSCGKSFGG